MKLKSISVIHHKGSHESPTVKLPLPQEVVISMSQGMGAPCKLLVKKGDKVKVGQLIGETTAFMSAPIYSSVSGEVTQIKDILGINGKTCQAAVISADGEQAIDESVAPPDVTDKASFIEAIKKSGLVGLGGAGFPAHVKLNIDQNKTPVDSLVINAAECEPFITSDYRQMIENADDVLDGIKTVMKYLEIKTAYIGIENNKPKAIKLFKEKTAGDQNIKVVELKSSYPQGAEKVIAFYCTGRIVAEGELPLNQGIIVMNVSSVAFVNSYLKTGMPLVERRLTVAGDAVGKAENVFAPIGTKFSDLLKFTNTDSQKVKKLISGGIMMGMTVFDFDAPTTKTTNAVLALKNSLCDGTDKNPTTCIRCGRCIKACPLNLMPRNFEAAYDRRDVEELEALKINLCMNCGSCTYVCPAKRKLAEKNQLAKAFIMSNKPKK